MGAFLRDGRRLHQSAVDMPIDFAVRINDLIGIILRDNRDGFFFASGGLEAKTGIGLCRLGYALLTHWSHWVCHERSSRIFGGCSGRFFGDGLRWLLSYCSRRLLLCRLHRFFRSHGGPLFRDRFYRLFRGTRRRLLGDHLNHIVCFLLIVVRKV